MDSLKHFFAPVCVKKNYTKRSTYFYKNSEVISLKLNVNVFKFKAAFVFIIPQNKMFVPIKEKNYELH